MRTRNRLLIYSWNSRLLAEGVDILAPACGLSTRTPLANIQALVSAARDAERKLAFAVSPRLPA